MPSAREFTLRVHVDGRRVAWSTGEWLPTFAADRAGCFLSERKAGRAGVIRLRSFGELGTVLEAIGNDVAPVRWPRRAR